MKYMYSYLLILAFLSRSRCTVLHVVVIVVVVVIIVGRRCCRRRILFLYALMSYFFLMCIARAGRLIFLLLFSLSK